MYKKETMTDVTAEIRNEGERERASPSIRYLLHPSLLRKVVNVCRWRGSGLVDVAQQPGHVHLHLHDIQAPEQSAL